ncbi:MAG TPA: AAA family ATPase [Rhizomicrobium sp.]|nr:AAA family ATPase [Rhizomicrobium sp.]
MSETPPATNTEVPVITPHVRRINVPTILRGKEGWLIWRAENCRGGTKPRKMPYYSHGGIRTNRHGSPADRIALTSFAAARDAAARRGFDGVGFAPQSGMNVVALDFDNCVGPNGELPEEIRDIVICTYAEYSPSGKGIRAFFVGDIGNHKSPTKDNPYGFEVFSSTGYVTVTGNILVSTELLGLEDTVAPVNDKVLALCDKRFGPNRQRSSSSSDDPFAGHEPKLGLSIPRMEEILKWIDPDIGRDQWIRVGMALHHECDGDDTGFALWNEWSSNGAKYLSEEDLQSQWESFDRPKMEGRKLVTMASVIFMAKEAGFDSSRQHATASELKEATAGVSTDDPSKFETPPDFNGKFEAISASALSKRPPPGWLIKNVLPRADVIVLFGPSGSAKSFIGMDMGGAVARGIPWWGNKTAKGRVLIIAAEGGGSIGKRLKAYAKHHGVELETLHIAVILAAPNFLQKDDITEVVAAVKAAGGCDLIITDTFAQVTAGANENSAEDMGLALANARALREATDAVVMLIHHSGKNPTMGSRGWSGIRAAADAELEVVKHDGGARELRVSKMKDGDEGFSFPFMLKTVELEVDADGDFVTSCVIERMDALPPSSDRKRGPKGLNQRIVFDMARELGAALIEGGDRKEAIDRAAASMERSKTARDQRRSHAERALAQLLKRRVLILHQGRLYEPGVAPPAEVSQ